MNQNPEQKARDKIDEMLVAAGWAVQNRNKVNLGASKGVALREYPTDVGPVDYLLFVDRKPVGVIEAKKAAEAHRLNVVEEQSLGYARSKLKYLNNKALPFVYESTGTHTRFTDYRDPKPRARTVFGFLRPETLAEWMRQGKSLRDRLLDIPALNHNGLRPAQIKAIENLEDSFKKNKPRALIQMATGAGKTFTAATFIYRLLKHADAKRVLFLVDTKNLGEQAEQEFMKYQPNDDNRKFTELYNVQRLSSSYIASDSQVCISTIQRLYSILKEEAMDDSAELQNPNESSWIKQQQRKAKALPVVYNEQVPLEQFDFIVIDECHRSIYNLWKQVLDYFDAFLIGLTATPDKRTFGFFNENVVSEYTYEESVADGVNVPYDVYVIETDISKRGSELKAGWYVDRRDKLTRRKRWQQMDEEVVYGRKDLDRKVVNKSQIRNIIREYKVALKREIFPHRLDPNGDYEVPKTLIFAKTDSHADDIIKIVREEFDEGNDFCKKVTYKISENPKDVINRFRNDYSPRIAVTVDMIATGTDIKPLEVVLFMRDVRSNNYFEQMKGRGSRTIPNDDFRARNTAIGSATKTHFVLVDAVGVAKSKKTDSRSLERKRGIAMKDLLGAVVMGAADEDLFLSLANRLVRLEKQITEKEKNELLKRSGGKNIKQISKALLNAYDPCLIEEEAIKRQIKEDLPSLEAAKEKVQAELIATAAAPFNGALNDYLENVRRDHEQYIDTRNIDVVTKSEWDKNSVDKAREVVKDFTEFLALHKDEIKALSIFYKQPYQRRDITFKMIKEVSELLKRHKPLLAPHYVWEAYTALEKVKGKCPKSELTALVSLIRRACGIDTALHPFDKTIDKNFQTWVFQKQAGALKFTEEQMQWLRMLKEHVANSFHLELDDLDYVPFNAVGGRGRMWQLFGDKMNGIIEELNEVLAA